MPPRLVTRVTRTTETRILALLEGANLDSLLTTFTLDRDVSVDLSTFTGGAGEVGELSALSAQGVRCRIIIVGLGSASAAEVRKAGAAAGRRLRGKESVVAIRIALAHAGAFLTSLSLATYAYNELKGQTEGIKQLEKIEIDTSAKWSKLAQTQAIIDGIFLARDLIHTPANVKSPAWLAAESALVAEAGGLKIRVREERELKKEGFGGILAVGESSRARGPRFIELTYAPRGSAKWPHVVLIGKGIVFDTGGISLKRPYDIMIPMKSDMAGVAGIIGTMSTLHVIKPKVRVTALLACAENTISGTAQRPSDVITHFGGTTVEVKDTDAEGRLVLADSLAYAAEVLKPDVVIDMATLTGAATLGLGRQFAALYSNDDVLALELEEAGLASGDRAWRMPLIDEYRDSLKSEIADFSNISSGGLGAGSIMAALFLQSFVGDYRWAHLDIAGAGRSEVDAGENIKGGTGYGVRILCEWLAKR